MAAPSIVRLLVLVAGAGALSVTPQRTTQRRSPAASGLSRRAALSSAAVALCTAPLATSEPATAASTEATLEATGKVVVVGGDGFIGSRVCRELTRLSGVSVLAVSRIHDQPPSWAASEPWAGNVKWVAADALKDDYGPLLEGATAVVSCLGTLGSADDRTGNGDANARLSAAAKKAGAKRFVYIGVNSLVGEIGMSVLPEYFAGKAAADTAITADFGSHATIFRPTLVYGGDVFNVNPPRVPAGYGGVIEGLLSSPPLRFLAEAFSPVPAIKVALLPPVYVDRMAAAVAVAALGGGPAGSVEGRDAINAVAASA